MTDRLDRELRQTINEVADIHNTFLDGFDEDDRHRATTAALHSRDRHPPPERSTPVTDIGRAASLLDDHDLDFDYGSGCRPRNIERAQALADAGLLAPDPQIIRTVDELEALDGDTQVIDVDEQYWDVCVALQDVAPHLSDFLPAVVVATGAQVRAARTALQEATE